MPRIEERKQKGTALNGIKFHVLLCMRQKRLQINSVHVWKVFIIKVLWLKPYASLPNIIPSGWFGSKHRLSNEICSRHQFLLLPFLVSPKGSWGWLMSPPVSGISGLSFDSTLLSPLLLFCLVLLPFLSYIFCLLALSSNLFPENSSIFFVKR